MIRKAGSIIGFIPDSLELIMEKENKGTILNYFQL